MPRQVGIGGAGDCRVDGGTGVLAMVRLKVSTLFHLLPVNYAPAVYFYHPVAEQLPSAALRAQVLEEDASAISSLTYS